jgi:hypothetical protein
VSPEGKPPSGFAARLARGDFEPVDLVSCPFCGADGREHRAVGYVARLTVEGLDSDEWPRVQSCGRCCLPEPWEPVGRDYRAGRAERGVGMDRIRDLVAAARRAIPTTPRIRLATLDAWSEGAGETTEGVAVGD